MQSHKELLSTRLAALKDSLDQSPRSANTSEFPWEYFCTLYFRAHSRDVYIENFKGLKLLYKWLGPITKPTEPAPNHSFHLIGYETQQLAKILEIDWRYIVQLILEGYANGTIPNK